MREILGSGRETYIMTYPRNLMCPFLFIPSWVIWMRLLDEMVKQPKILNSKPRMRRWWQNAELSGFPHSQGEVL